MCTEYVSYVCIRDVFTVGVDLRGTKWPIKFPIIPFEIEFGGGGGGDQIYRGGIRLR